MNEEILSLENFKKLARLLIKTWGPNREAIHRGMSMASDPVRAMCFGAVIDEEAGKEFSV